METENNQPTQDLQQKTTPADGKALTRSDQLLAMLDAPKSVYIPPKPIMPLPPIKTAGNLLGGVRTKEREAEIVCEKHGNKTITQRQLESIEFPEPKCEPCEAERKDADRIKHEEWVKQERIGWEQERINHAIGRAAIPLRFRDRTLKNYIPDNPNSKGIKDICEKYIADFEENRKAGRSIIFCGNAGTGKTHLACGMAQEIIRSGGSALYSTAGGAFRMVKDTFNTKQTETEIIEKFVRPDFLIIDEIGVQYGSDTEKNILFDIINTRYENMKPTAIISNLTAEELISYAGERVIDRMKENRGIVAAFNWKSNRK